MRPRKMKRFNIFLFLVLGLISMILSVEMVERIRNGTGISSDEILRYVTIWLSFLFGIAFINLVDVIVGKIGGRSAEP